MLKEFLKKGDKIYCMVVESKLSRNGYPINSLRFFNYDKAQDLLHDITLLISRELELPDVEQHRTGAPIIKVNDWGHDVLYALSRKLYPNHNELAFRYVRL